jgi:hypothetical protein
VSVHESLSKTPLGEASVSYLRWPFNGISTMVRATSSVGAPSFEVETLHPDSDATRRSSAVGGSGTEATTQRPRRGHATSGGRRVRATCQKSPSRRPATLNPASPPSLSAPL